MRERRDAGWLTSSKIRPAQIATAFARAGELVEREVMRIALAVVIRHDATDKANQAEAEAEAEAEAGQQFWNETS